jgi:hypothetical protein
VNDPELLHDLARANRRAQRLEGWLYVCTFAIAALVGTVLGLISYIIKHP